MPLLLLILFIGVPLLEIAVFIEVGERIGLGWTLLVVVATAIIGTGLLRQQGFATLRSAQDSMAQGALPMRELFDGVCLLFAGALLLTPGFVTDAVGFALFLPPVRGFLRHLVAQRVHLHAGGVHHGPDGGVVDPLRPDLRQAPPGPGSGPTIDGDYVEVDEPPRDGSVRS